MAQVRLLLLNIFFVLMIYFSAMAGLVMVTELKTSAAENIASRGVSEVESARPVAPWRNISSQRLAPLEDDSSLPPFWSR